MNDLLPWPSTKRSVCARALTLTLALPEPISDASNISEPKHQIGFNGPILGLDSMYKAHSSHAVSGVRRCMTYCKPWKGACRKQCIMLVKLIHESWMDEVQVEMGGKVLDMRHVSVPAKFPHRTVATDNVIKKGYLNVMCK